MKYKFILILCLEIFSLSQYIDNNSSYINQKDFFIKNAIYIIRNKNGNVNLEFYPNIEFTNTKSDLKQHFELIKHKSKNNSSGINYYFIKEKNRNYLLSAEEEGDHLINYNYDIDINYALWNITPIINKKNQLIYYIQNKKTRCYWEFIKQNIDNKGELKLRKKSKEFPLNTDNEFIFIELYKEVKIKDSDILENEPIDVLIKYIDLSDEDLNRKGIHNVQKDYENRELKYSVRSILQNIPWIRKIFILMPNERVKYFLPEDQIKDKIVYIRDKNLLGFDSANSCTFQYNLYKMRQFGLSENFILMDDNYFIAKPINKNEMFYEENGEIFPAIITSDYYEMNKDLLEKQIDQLSKRRENNNPHTAKGFLIRQKRALLFLYDLFGNDNIRFGKKLIEPTFTHNAIPAKLSDIEELRKYIYDYYEFGKLILYSKEKTIQDLQFQTLYWGYVKNKYDRKVSTISSESYDILKAINIKGNTKRLFAIKASSKNYNQMIFEKEKKVLQSLFPMKSEYEIDEEEEKRKIMLTKSNKLLISLLINKIKENIQSYSQKYIITLNSNLFFRKVKDLNSNQNEYKKILLEEIGYMRQQCIWQEMINFIFIIFFLLLLINRHMKNKNYKNEKYY